MTPMEKPPRIVDGEFVALAIAAAMATVMDVESTVQAQRDPDAVEVNAWLYGERPTRTRMYGVNVPLTAALTCLAYHWRRKHGAGPNRWVWRTPLVAAGLGHAAAGIANLLNFPLRRFRESNTARTGSGTYPFPRPGS